MSHVPQRQERYTAPHVYTSPGSNPSGSVPLLERNPDKVLYGPKGEVILRVEDRPFLGFHRENGITCR